MLLAEKAKAQPGAAALLKEATEQIATGITSFNPDPKKLLDLRARIAKLLSVQ